MEEIKVKFIFGNNEKYEYFIIDKRIDAKEIEIDPNSLAYKIGGPGKYKVTKYGQLPFGNFDYLLEVRNKENSDFRGLKLVSEDEIEKTAPNTV